MMGRRWHSWHSPLGGGPEIDLLTTAFGIPSGRELARLSRCRSASTRVISKPDETSEGEGSLYASDDESTNNSNTSSKATRVTRLASGLPKRRSRGHGTLSRLLSSKKSRSRVVSKQSRSRKSSSRSYSDSSSKIADNNSSSRGSLKSDRRRTSSISVGCQTSPEDERPKTTERVGARATPFAVNPAVPAYLYTQFPYTQQQCMTSTQPIYHAAPHPLAVPVVSNRNRFNSLERLQQDLNNVRSKLGKNTENQGLKIKEADLQGQLNDVLNAIVSTKAAPANKKSTAAQNPKADIDKLLGITAPRSASAGASETVRKRDHRRGDSKSSTAVRHHLCSGCSGIRSRDYHDKYPLDHRGRSLNLCYACRQKKLVPSRVGKYHFCSGCGHVRSKAFQRKHGARSSLYSLANYCSKCTSEVKSSERIHDISMLDLGGVELDIISVQQSAVEEQASAKLAHSEEHAPSGRQNADKNAVSATRKYERSVKSSPATPAEASPFLPGRRLGSSHRRAQRTLAEERGGDESIPCIGMQENTEYVAPYVEDVTSAAKDVATETAEPAGSGTAKRSMSPKSADNDAKSQSSSRKRALDSSGNTGSRSTTSSGSKTIRSPPSRTSKSKTLSRRSANAKQTPAGESQDHGAKQQQTHSYRGAFSTLKTSAFDFGHSTFDRCISPHNGEAPRKGQSRKRSPLAECDSNSRSPEMQHRQRHAAESEVPPIFGSSKGVFEQSYIPREQTTAQQTSYGSMYDRFQDISGDASSGNNSRSSKEFSAQSSYASTAPASDEDAKRRSCAEEPFTHTAFTAETAENPYYQPPSKEFREFINSGSFYSGWSWSTGPSQRHERETQSSRRYSAEYTDPIIEEPYSPPGSPRQQPTLLLEFKIYDSDSTSVGETDSLVDKGSSSCDAVSSVHGWCQPLRTE